MTTYFIYIKSDKHARTMNTPKMGRTYYEKFVVEGKENMVAKVRELKAKGEVVTEVCTTLGKRIWEVI